MSVMNINEFILPAIMNEKEERRKLREKIKWLKEKRLKKAK